jgi:hypothetical protein
LYILSLSWCLTTQGTKLGEDACGTCKYNRCWLQ